MTIWITQGRYSKKALDGFIDKPEDRRDAVAKLMKAAGGRLIDYYVTFGDYDFMVISEGKDEEDLMSALMVAGATGGVTDLRTMAAMSTADAKKAMEKAKAVRSGFKPAGG